MTTNLTSLLNERKEKEIKLCYESKTALQRPRP